MRTVAGLVAFACLLGTVSPAKADLMVIWDFGPDAIHYTLNPAVENVVGIPVMTAGGAEYDPDGKNGIAFTDAAGIPHPAGQAVAWDDVSGTESDAEWTIRIDTTGWQDMVIRWDYFSDNTGGNRGPVSFDLEYRVGGADWSVILNNQPIIRDDAWHPFTYDLSGIVGIDNQPDVEFRVDDLDQADENGDYRFDNLQLTGSPILSQLTLLGPNGGEQLLVGTIYTISWDSDVGITSVLIEYSTTNGLTWTPVAPPNSGNTGYYDWVVPIANSDQCLVRISDGSNPATNDVSDGVFTIFQCQGPIIGDLNVDCYVNFLDLAILLASWLDCGNPFDPACGL